MDQLIDPRRGDAEDDVSSPKQRSMLAIAGSLLSEISLPKLVLTFLLMMVGPALLLGAAPLVVSAWLTQLSADVATLAGIASFLLLGALLALGWFVGRPLLRLAERSFWSLNSIAVQPFYAFWREALRHVIERHERTASPQARARMRGATAIGAGVIACGFALVMVALAWPSTRFIGEPADLMDPQRFMLPAIANSIVILGAYLAAAALGWGLADGTMPQPRDLPAFDADPGGQRWRVAHLSDIHIVGEPYGFRVESGRSGSQGNRRLERVLARLEEIHAADPLDLVLVTGDMTDAGVSGEWAYFMDVVDRHPALRERMLILPGNHDLNVVDRSNPARLDLPTSPGKRLRQMRCLSAMEAIQGRMALVARREGGVPVETLSDWLAPKRAAVAAFADAATLRLSFDLGNIWDEMFPLVLPPATEDGLGVLVLNSNAETHFSFTNALGTVSIEQARELAGVMAAYPRARWIIALHHHVVEYPKPAKKLSERVGTALINGSWFVRQLLPVQHRIVIMHGHRHIDWIGECAGLRIVSAPSPVMVGHGVASTFLIHTLAAGPDGSLLLLDPQRESISAEPA
jgi:hypothetical protein